jgi:thiamine-monophosphate kinase
VDKNCTTEHGSSDAQSLSEHDLIARHFRPLATTPDALDLMDDAAVMTPPSGCDLVLSIDTIVEGVHFLSQEAPGTVAKRALRVNLSDLIAKGADPSGYLLSLSLGSQTPENWVAEFAAALNEDQAHYGFSLLGGDTVRGSQEPSSPISVTLTVVGTVPHGEAVRRSNARTGDIIVVTGSIGDAALGLRVALGETLGSLTLKHRRALELPYRLPEPPFGIAQALRSHAHAAMDISDGLVGDLDKLCAASGVSAVVEVTRVPLSAAARAAIASDSSLLGTCLTGGDDYQVLATMPEDAFAGFSAACEMQGIAATQIGRITDPGVPVEVLDAEGQAIAFEERAYSHVASPC